MVFSGHGQVVGTGCEAVISRAFPTLDPPTACRDSPAQVD